MKIILALVLIFFTFIVSADPLDEIDGTESWYEGTMEGNGDIVYYNASYEKDMKKYLAYLKSKQKSKVQIKSLSSKINRRKSSNYDDSKDDEIGALGTLKDDDKLGDDLLLEDDTEDKTNKKRVEEVKKDKKEDIDDSLDDDDLDLD